MSGGELLLELLSEEIPARMQRRAIEDLTGLVRDKLAAAELAAKNLRGYVTPRRLTVIADGIPARQPDMREERRGPRVGAPARAVEGFLRAAGLDRIEQCEVRNTDRGEFYFATIERPGRAAATVLSEIVHVAIAELPWPKSMRFPAASFRWVRPLTSAICLFKPAPAKAGGEIVPLQLGQVPVGRITRGHRFLSPAEFEVTDATDYLRKLEKAHVVLDQDRRREIIDTGLNKLAKGAGLKLKSDPGLLDEVTGLVEYPLVLMGTIDDDSMALPPEVLATAMRTHQKYFTCLNMDGTTAPRFLFVANNKTPDDGATIVAGNERVLKARLADARFFWDQDRKVPLAARVDALKDRVYHEKLGSVYDKVDRMEKLAELLVTHVPGADVERSRRAVRLAKADLSTGMVGEFPELQGIMGRYYALGDGEDLRVADAIADHYKPLGPNDTCPKAPDGIVAALADKIDTLAAFFAIDQKPTGSRDPFALRRAAQGVIRLILENELRVPLGKLFKQVRNSLGGAFKTDDVADIAAAEELLQFIADRLKVHLREQGVRHDLITAAFETLGFMSVTQHYEDDLVRLQARVSALDGFLKTEDGANLLVAFRRASNIVRIEQTRDEESYGGPIDEDQLNEPEEQRLFQVLSGMDGSLQALLVEERFDRAMSHLATLRRPVDDFFDRVTVNVNNTQLRTNRLRLLSRINETMNQVADFSQIEG